MDRAVKQDRLVFSAEVLMNICRCELGSIAKRIGRIFFQHELEVFEGLRIVVPIPENLPDLVKRLGGFGAVGVLARDLLQ